MSYAIGAQTFDLWTGPPQLVSQHLTTLAKPGLAGYAAIATGIRGEPFSFSTQRYFTTQANSRAAAIAYAALPNAGLLDITYNGVTYYANYNHKFLVLGVKIKRDDVHPLYLGATLISPAWLIEADWNLLPIYVA